MDRLAKPKTTDRPLKRGRTEELHKEKSPEYFTKFLVIHSTNDQVPITTKSVFAIATAIQSVVSPPASITSSIASEPMEMGSLDSGEQSPPTSQASRTKTRPGSASQTTKLVGNELVPPKEPVVPSSSLQEPIEVAAGPSASVPKERHAAAERLKKIRNE
ncbi:hypothetical protein HPB50_024839 [Hyalomma asiaticum]|uniref:Uncharacterized protein n=1 Tax=Hyalomma asiaticum TaxID=266040 RepID=A0ACB7T9X2_HYAAI|nr:hypothetical protein HPB50_024839 [Hyalomma asiaticum]